MLCSDGRHFCAGAKFGEPTGDADQDADPVDTDALYARSLALFSLSKPVVAAVQGGAVGGGAGLALSADFRVGEPASWFAFNFARLGIHQGFGISATLPRVAGQQRALDLLYTGRRIKGEEARAAGLFDRLAEPGTLRGHRHRPGRRDRRQRPAGRAVHPADHARGPWPRRCGRPIRSRPGSSANCSARADFRRGVDAAARREEPAFEGD